MKRLHFSLSTLRLWHFFMGFMPRRDYTIAKTNSCDKEHLLTHIGEHFFVSLYSDSHVICVIAHLIDFPHGENDNNTPPFLPAAFTPNLNEVQ